MLKVILLLGRYLLLVLLYVFIYRLVMMVIKEWKLAPEASRVKGHTVTIPTGEEPRLAELVVLGSSDRTLPVGKIIPVGASFDIGRGNENDLVVRDSFTSQEHARLTLINGQFWLSDQGSTNGTLLNGEKLTQPAIVKTGHEIRVGEAVFRFVRCSYEVE